MAIFSKVDSSLGYAFRKPSSYYKACHTLNPSTLLPTEMKPLACDCTEIIYAIQSSSLDLESELFPNAREKWFTAWSSFIREGERLAGYTVTSQAYVLETRSLPPGTFAQRAKLMAFTRALKIRTGKILNVYTRLPAGVCHSTHTWGYLKEKR